MKKNNPGCNCCGDVLIWNLDNAIPCDVRRNARINFPSHPATNYVNPRNATDTNWNRLGFENFKSTLRAEGIKVDEVTRLNPNNWSGSIENYKLIIWPLPNRAPDCDFCPNKEDPEWWPDVDSGEWAGRIVLLFDSPYHHVAQDNDWWVTGTTITFGSDCSMLSEEDAITTASQDHFKNSELDVNWPEPNLNSTPGSQLGVLTSTPTSHALMEGVTQLYHQIFHPVSGGTCLATTTVTSASTGEDVEHCWMRELTVGSQSRVICGDTSHIVDPLGSIPAEGGGTTNDPLQTILVEDTTNKQFWRNLFNVPVGS